MKNLTITIETNGKAFEETPNDEVARILRDLADSIEAGGSPNALFDFNGNRAGSVTYDFGN